MPVLTFPFGALEAQCHILHNGVDAVVADPTPDTAQILTEVSKLGLTLRAILLTHLHFDHALGCAALSQATGLPVLVGKEDWDMRDVLLSRAMMFGMDEVPKFDATTLAPGSVSWGSLNCEVIHAPGHSAGSLCFYFPAEKVLLSGDVLFYRSVGRADLPGGDSKTLTQTLRNSIFTLPPATVVYPGHGRETNVGDEAANNPFCRA